MLIQCPAGHKYDNVLNTNCPYCPIGGVQPGAGTPNFKNAKRASGASDPPGGGGGFKPGGQAAGAGPKRTSSKTEAYYPGLGAPEPGKPATRVDPVVGWLVGIKGPALGQDFQIRWGFNTVGRSPSQMIAIEGDTSIHSENHAKIIFDPLHRKFHIMPGGGAGQGFARVNGDMVLQPTELLPYNIIELSPETQLIFVPLCGIEFEWRFNDPPKEDQL